MANDNTYTFGNLPVDQRVAAGGKGGTLSRLFCTGFPVPDGFVILPDAFVGDQLTAAAWTDIQAHLARMRNENGKTSFAVRSSALSEDSVEASFAGEFETVLDVHTDEMIREAIHTVRRSRSSARVQSYSKAKRLDSTHEVSVVVQRLVPADISGILFTADPVTGSRTVMSGNYIQGLGDALVSGEAEPHTFSLGRPKGSYAGPAEMKPYARKLYKLAIRLEKELQGPQDIEWCIAERKLFILQSRPITTLVGFDPITCDWNASHTGDYLWCDSGGVYPEVMTPATWSVWESILGRSMSSTVFMGNIGGRLYLNFSLMYYMIRKVGRSHEQALNTFALAAGRLPEGATIPPVQIAWRDFLQNASIPLLMRQRKLVRGREQTMTRLKERCDLLIRQIDHLDQAGLISLWNDELPSHFMDAYLTQDAFNEAYSYPYGTLRNVLTKAMGAEEAVAFIATIGVGGGEMASLGITRGLIQVAHGEMSQAEYMQEYGHRHANENELAVPRPHEEPQWLERQLADQARNPVNLDVLKAKRKKDHDVALADLERRFPKQVKKVRKLIDKVNEATYWREAARSELTRTIGVFRAWYLRAADLTGLGDDIFMLPFNNVLDLLAGDEACLAYIPDRRQVYQRYRSLPQYPGWIRGRFDPVKWAADPNRRVDYFDPHAPLPPRPDSTTLRGNAGSAGRIEGNVRIIHDLDQGHRLLPGEVLVAVTTNIGWTPLFPRAAAVVTDIGAPLAHAAIVARELGIPAVVGCGDATLRLRTGDRVLVDGARGVVEILNA